MYKMSQNLQKLALFYEHVQKQRTNTWKIIKHKHYVKIKHLKYRDVIYMDGECHKSSLWMVLSGLKVTFEKNWRSQNFNFLSLKFFSPSQFFGSSNSCRYNLILKLLVAI